MNFGGSIINNARSVYDSTGHDDFDSSGNSILNDFIRPWYHSDRTNMRKKYDFNGYGDRAYDSDSSSTIRKSGIETLLNAFLGSSFFGQTPSPSATNTANFFKPDFQQNENYHTKGGSDIDRLVNMLVRSGVQRATPNPNISPNLLQAIFGKRK
ncbi:unnamed protein product [Onchocerca ochengi]|nr:unnamed protein product [Onchocerca ochengi]